MEKFRDCVVIGHAHMKTDKRLRGFDEIWRTILHDMKHIRDLKVFGRGWEHFSMYNPEIMTGTISPAEVAKEFAISKYTPVAITGGELYTNKGRFALMQGCLPLYYGDGGPFTMDPLGKHIALNSMFRIVKPHDLLRFINYYNSHEKLRQEIIKDLLALTEPDYSILDTCIDDILSGKDTTNQEWWEKYGGYRKCT